MDYKILPNLAKNTENIETFTIEIENKNSKNILISAVYRPPRGNRQVVHNSNHSTKSFFSVGDLNLHSLDYASSTPVKKFFNLAFENRNITDQDLQNGIIKLDIIDDFPIFTILSSKIHNECLKAKLSTRAINEVSVENFKNTHSLTDWIIPFDLTILDNTITNESYDQFIKTFSLIYDDC